MNNTLCPFSIHICIYLNISFVFPLISSWTISPFLSFEDIRADISSRLLQTQYKTCPAVFSSCLYIRIRVSRLVVRKEKKRKFDIRTRVSRYRTYDVNDPILNVKYRKNAPRILVLFPLSSTPMTYLSL